MSFDIAQVENHPCRPGKGASTLFMPNGSIVATDDWQLSGIMGREIVKLWGVKNNDS